MAKDSSTPRVYIDSPLVFNVVKREPGLWSGSLKVLLAGERGDIKLVSSTLLLAEVCGYRGDVDAVTRDDMIDRFLDDKIEWIEVDRFVIQDARKLSDPFKLRGLDATHLACAVRLKANYLMTRDEDFPIGQTVKGVKIIQPGPVWNETFDDVEVDRQAAEEEAVLRKVEGGVVIMNSNDDSDNGTMKATVQ